VQIRSPTSFKKRTIKFEPSEASCYSRWNIWAGSDGHLCAWLNSLILVQGKNSMQCTQLQQYT